VVLERLLDPWRGTAQARRMHGRLLAGHPGLKSGVQEIIRRCPLPDSPDDDSPIFLFSAGWRSGSTLLQRLIISGTDTLIWGEPYDECGAIQRLAEGLKAFRSDWPPADYFYDGRPPGELTEQWIANLFPALEDLRASHRAFFDRLFAEPARRAGAKRWGLKEVRLTADHAAYLRWLYPNAKFLLLYRNPLNAYRSYCRYGRSWYETFPDRPVFTPTAFGMHWRVLLEGYLAEADDLGALLVRYEDLTRNPATLDLIEGYLGTSIDRFLIGNKVGSSERSGKIAEVSRVERWLLRRAVGPLAGELGYKW
jgi:hypothetical protein